MTAHVLTGQKGHRKATDALYSDETDAALPGGTVESTGTDENAILVAGGGTLYASGLTVTTNGGSSIAIRSDRGSA